MAQPQYLHVPTRPSPLAQVHHTRPASRAPPGQGPIRDPLFWKRFSTAVHMNEAMVVGLDEGGRPIDLESQRRNTGSSSSSGGSVKKEDDWMAQQRREKRRCRTLCITITIVVILLIVGAAFVGWYFTKVQPIHISF